VTTTITSVTISGDTVSLNDIILDVILTHGRSDVTAPASPSVLDLRIFATGLTNVPYQLGDPVVMQADNVTRFTGAITDLAVAHSTTIAGNPPMTTIDVTAVGKLANLARIVTSTERPAETLQERVDAILTATGLTYSAQADPENNLLEILAADASQQDTRTQLDELAQWTGGTMYDKPDGTVVYESYTRRGYSYATATWGGMVGDYAAQIGDWASQYAPGDAAPTAVTLPSGAVVWEPVWQATSNTIVNDVSVTYGAADPQDIFQDTEPVSIALFGTRAVTITTGLVDATDAATRASLVLTAQASERWQLGGVEVLIDQLTNLQRTAVLGLTSGDRVIVTDLPTPNPISQFLGVVEGWRETYNLDGYRLTLSLSDPRYSYAMVSWGEVSPTAQWGNVPLATTWADAVLPSNLGT